MRDILATLKESLLDLSAAKFSLQGQLTGETNKQTEQAVISKEEEELLAQHVFSSVDQGALQSRISRLTQYISEATWRYQLVSHDWLPQEIGKVAIDLHCWHTYWCYLQLL